MVVTEAGDEGDGSGKPARRRRGASSVGAVDVEAGGIEGGGSSACPRVRRYEVCGVVWRHVMMVD